MRDIIHWAERRKESRFVYMIRVVETQFYKIGIASNPSNRMNNLQTANPLRLEITALSPRFKSMEIAMNHERFWHSHLQENSAPGGVEWFVLDAESAEWVAGEIQAGRNPRGDYRLGNSDIVEPPREWLTISEAARSFKVTRRVIMNMIRNGEFKTSKEPDFGAKKGRVLVHILPALNDGI
jgi:Meiotically up-regulated gene 113